MRYEIVATLGPSSASPAIWQKMIAAGATAFRLNTSHLTLEQLVVWLKKIRVFRADTGLPVPLVLDLQGSKWRLGKFPTFDLQKNEIVELVCRDQIADAHSLPVPHADFFRAAQDSDGQIILNDAKSRLEVISTAGESLTARVVTGGIISAHKGITFGETQFRVEAISEKDRQIIYLAAQDRSIRYAISYVRDADEMQRYRQLIGKSAYLIAKLERPPAVTGAEEIAEYCDELWLCRGDLGAELGLRGMAVAAAAFTRKIAHLTLPVLMAGQVLEHMTAQPAPTRSEICYLLEMLMQGYRGFVLSDETAIGQYPVESCQTAGLFLNEDIQLCA